jgi:DNA (cytosine-5)-methyltransferase 1
MRVLNLYAGIGGNRKLWEDVEVTAVEWDPKISAVYRKLFPEDHLVVGDAHQYLLDHHTEFDFIWSSPPCPTHSRSNNFLYPQGVIRYPDMGLYQEIIFLEKRFKGQYCVENVVSYYNPLITPIQVGRHYLWTNFMVTAYREPERDFNITNARESVRVPNKEYSQKLTAFHGFEWDPDLGNDFQIQMLKNAVYPGLGLHVLDCARGNTQQTLGGFIDG